MRLVVVILNYRSAELTMGCLGSLAGELASIPGGARAIVVDNASPDDSVERCRALCDAEGWSTWLSFIALTRNGGYAAGNNAAIRAGLESDRPDYFWVLNPDTIVHPGAGQALVDFMDRRREAGVAGSRLVDGNGRLQCSAHANPSIWTEFDAGARWSVCGRLLRRQLSPPAQDDGHPCDWVSGSSLIVRREVFETVGLMDEGYFLYFDEVDFCKRTRDAGWSCWYVPESVVTHLEGASTGIHSVPRRPAYWYNSRRRFFIKSYGVLGSLSRWMR